METMVILVVLMHALPTTVQALFSTVAPWLRGRMASKEYVEMLRDVFQSLAGIGPTIGVVIGIQENTTAAYALAVLFYLASMTIVHALTTNLEALNSEQSENDKRKIVHSLRREFQQRGVRRRRKRRSNRRG